MQDDFAQTVVDYTATVPSGMINIVTLGGKAGRLPINTTAFPHRNGSIILMQVGRAGRVCKDEDTYTLS